VRLCAPQGIPELVRASHAALEVPGPARGWRLSRPFEPVGLAPEVAAGLFRLPYTLYFTLNEAYGLAPEETRDGDVLDEQQVGGDLRDGARREANHNGAPVPPQASHRRLEQLPSDHIEHNVHAVGSLPSQSGAEGLPLETAVVDAGVRTLAVHARCESDVRCTVYGIRYKV